MAGTGARHEWSSNIPGTQGDPGPTQAVSPCSTSRPSHVTRARQAKMTHQYFLQLVLSDEVTRPDGKSAVVRAQRANLDPAMVIDAWGDSSGVTFDRDL